MLGRYADFATILAALFGVGSWVWNWFQRQHNEVQRVLSRNRDERIKKVEDNLTVSWEKYDKLKEELRGCVTREEGEKWRSEMKADFTALRMEIKNDLDRLGTRIVEQLKDGK